ncbi:MAG TPA: metalloregulator ArsR/SmtB family transcription factor [Ktedonobacterales bacterium]|nr:metalloregulator ArsR/SmtB family transcription factor [Ktedonobacterales bacterium]
MNSTSASPLAGEPGHGALIESAADAGARVRGEREATGALADESAALRARFFRALGDPTRLRLLQLLTDAPSGECAVGELVAAIGAPQSRVSTHLGCLRWCGLVQTRRDGKQVYYRVADPRVRQLLALGGAVLRDHAAGVASCGMIR